jgi:hypothetical protein
MSAVDYEQRAVGVLQHPAADGSDEFLEMLTVVGADDTNLADGRS